MSLDNTAIADEAILFVRRQLERAGLAGSLQPRIGNPRIQGWIYGFAKAVPGELGLSSAETYTFQARLYVKVFEGSPMGEQLGLETLAMALQLDKLPGAAALRTSFRAHESGGAHAATLFVALIRSLDGLYEALTV